MKSLHKIDIVCLGQMVTSLDRKGYVQRVSMIIKMKNGNPAGPSGLRIRMVK